MSESEVSSTAKSTGVWMKAQVKTKELEVLLHHSERLASNVTASPRLAKTSSPALDTGAEQASKEAVSMSFSVSQPAKAAVSRIESVSEVRAGIFILVMELNLQSGLFCKVVYGRHNRTVNIDKMVRGM